MGAFIYGPPEHITMPDFDSFRDEEGRWNGNGYMEAVKEFEQKVVEWCKENGQGNLAGKTWRYQIADGYASYVVLSSRPLALIEVSDEYRIPEVLRAGLTAAALREEIARQERISALFSPDTKETA